MRQISKPQSSDQITLAIIDSTATGQTAAIISNTNTAITTDTISIGSGKTLTFSSGATAIPTPITKAKSDLLADKWVKDNTIADIKYLTQVIDTNPLIIPELDSTLPNDLPTLARLTGDAISDADANDIISESTSSTNTAKDIKRKGKKALCKSEGQQYWSSLDGVSKTPSDYCKERTLLAFADYTNNGNGTLYLKNGTSITTNKTWGDSVEGAKIEGNQYIQYDINTLNEAIGGLAGKKFEVGFNGMPFQGTLLDFSDNIKVTYLSSQWKYNIGSGWTTPTNSSIISIDTSNISFKMPSGLVPTRFIFGNNSNLGYTNPIRTTVEYIRIY